jgi:hypothetical protein
MRTFELTLLGHDEDDKTDNLVLWVGTDLTQSELEEWLKDTGLRAGSVELITKIYELPTKCTDIDFLLPQQKATFVDRVIMLTVSKARDPFWKDRNSFRKETDRKLQVVQPITKLLVLTEIVCFISCLSFLFLNVPASETVIYFILMVACGFGAILTCKRGL